MAPPHTPPPLGGKELILKALIMTRTWFLAAVNAIPVHIEKYMIKIIIYFIWDGNKED